VCSKVGTVTFVKLVNSDRVDRVKLSLTEFAGFRVFNPILHVIYGLTHKIV